MQMDTTSSSSLDIDSSIESISTEFNRQIELKCDEVRVDDEEHEDSENLEIDGGDDFTFMLIGDNESAIDGDKAFEDGQIRKVFPLFDQKLLLDGEYDVEEIDRLPIRPPVDKIFVQSPGRFPSSTALEHEENDGATDGAYCAWSKESGTATAELSKKSNSTGFSKLWRLKEIVGRSNSSGRDAFVFFKSSDRTTTAATAATSSSSSSSKAATADGTFVKVNVAGGKARVVKAKKSTVSAHEAYLRSRGVHTEEERRRSYLPYRPELMGFFTNVHGGLTKNVHPY